MFDDLSRARQSHADAARAASSRRSAVISRAFRSSSGASSQHAGTLSGGEKKMLSFARGLAEDQPVILLDEPSEGVQWENILHMEALIAREEGGRRRVRSWSSRTSPSPSASPTAI